MKKYILVLSAICICSITYSQEKTLFSDQDRDLWEDLTIKKNDTSLLYKELFKDNSLAQNSYLLPDYKQIQKLRAFYNSENSALKHVMPIYIPKGDFKHKSLFPDNSMNHFIIVEPVKER